MPRARYQIKSFVYGFLTVLLTLPLLARGQVQFEQAGGSGFLFIPNFFGASPGPAGGRTLGGVILLVINIALLTVGGLAVVFLLYGGFRYITSFGNEEQAESAKRIIKDALLGLIIVLFSFAIVAVITNIIVAGNP